MTTITNLTPHAVSIVGPAVTKKEAKMRTVIVLRFLVPSVGRAVSP